jgi:hypothetical protein
MNMLVEEPGKDSTKPNEISVKANRQHIKSKCRMAAMVVKNIYQWLKVTCTMPSSEKILIQSTEEIPDTSAFSSGA